MCSVTVEYTAAVEVVSKTQMGRARTVDGAQIDLSAL